MPLGTEVGLGPDDIVLDGAQLPPPEKGAPIFGRCLFTLLWPNGRPSQQLLGSCHVLSSVIARVSTLLLDFLTFCSINFIFG